MRLARGRLPEERTASPMANARSAATPPVERRQEDAVLWMVRWLDIPLNYVLDALRDREEITLLSWQEPAPNEWEWAGPRRQRRARRSRGWQYYGRELRVRRARSDREYPLTVTLVSPRLLWRLIKAPEDVVVAHELNGAALFAVMSKIRKGRKVVALVEGDATHLGATGTASVKVLLRRLIARFVDVFVSNSSGSTTYLVEALRVPRDRICEGWWLAGLPPGQLSAGADNARRVATADDPVFLTAGQLIPRKGIDLLLEAIARYRRDHGPCRLRIVGDGPERHRLEQQAERLGIGDCAEFVGAVPHQQMGSMLRSCDLFVFPTLYDLVGRVVVEALSVGIPVVVSRLSGATGTLIRDGENGIVMDPRNAASLTDGLRRATQPDVYDRIAAGARSSATMLTPQAAADTIADAISRARRDGRARS